MQMGHIKGLGWRGWARGNGSSTESTAQWQESPGAPESRTVLFKLLYKNVILPVTPICPIDKRGSLTNAGVGS